MPLFLLAQYIVLRSSTGDLTLWVFMKEWSKSSITVLMVPPPPSANSSSPMRKENSWPLLPISWEMVKKKTALLPVTQLDEILLTCDTIAPAVLCQRGLLFFLLARLLFLLPVPFLLLSLLPELCQVEQDVSGMLVHRSDSLSPHGARHHPDGDARVGLPLALPGPGAPQAAQAHHQFTLPLQRAAFLQEASVEGLPEQFLCAAYVYCM